MTGQPKVLHLLIVWPHYLSVIACSFARATTPRAISFGGRFDLSPFFLFTLGLGNQEQAFPTRSSAVHPS